MSTSSDDPQVKCALCMNALETFTVKIPFTALEDIVLVNCRRCERMIYARRESRYIAEAHWKATA